MQLALLIVALVFAGLTFVRIAGARRSDLFKHWPAAALGAGALYELARGGVWPAIGLGALAALSYVLTPSHLRSNAAPAPMDPRDTEARAVLGVVPNATAAEIQAAYRAKMARAHPDRGGGHAEAARLNAARDRLLKRSS